MSDAAPTPSAAQPSVTWTRRTRSIIDVKYGRVVIRLRPDLAPKHVERVKLLCHGAFL